jgi:hypothetical protein
MQDKKILRIFSIEAGELVNGRLLIPEMVRTPILKYVTKIKLLEQRIYFIVKIKHIVTHQDPCNLKL